MTRDAPALSATTKLPGVSFDDMRLMILAEVEEHDATLREDTATSLILDTGGGLFGVRMDSDDKTEFIVAANDPKELFFFKEGAVEHIKSAFPEIAEAIRWSDGDASGSLPPNFQFVRVQSVAPVGEAFLRVIFEADDFSAYGDDAIHFRVVLPPMGVRAEWPKLAPNGSVKWPDGNAAPHKPAYTARRVDHSAGTLDMDVFIHDGGRMTEWAQGLMAGTETRDTIGLIGPGGGGLITETDVLIGTDETGFPPVARLIESLPSGARAEVFLEAQHGAACAYPMPQREGVTLHWLSRTKGETAMKAVLDVLDEHDDSIVWFAGERDAAQQVREVAKGQARAKGSLRISGFWSAGDVDG